ncbi:RrF2 family transcriptional regulator [Marinilabilia salmonicolor]|uniref:RrF2 family transcriptional regulator n=1 Tax=Marinilabilia salmonicolor TaxID=989 RepID=UPI001F1B992C|nr:Rrf2 family transcriptional regulator [Marinilabilia salmonicolor]
MKFPKRVHYGLVFLLQLHYAWPGHRSVKELAESDNLPPKFLEGIAVDFRKSAIVKVKRGAQGGYRLARPLKEISLLEVFRCLDLSGRDKVKKTEGAAYFQAESNFFFFDTDLRFC